MKDNNLPSHDDAKARKENSDNGLNRIKVGITHGDYNGIGYEIIIKALEDNRILELCTPIIYGSAKIAAFYRKTMDLQGTPFVQITEPSQARTDLYNIINVIGQDAHIAPGEELKEAGEAALAALDRAMADLRDGKIDVLVTAPINKHNIQCENFNFPGHTEYLAAAANSFEKNDTEEQSDEKNCEEPREENNDNEAANTLHEAKPLMILCNERLRVALVTTHMPISEISSHITIENIVEKLEIFNRSLVQDFSIVKPRIAVLALNPHAGENGLLGNEENDTIIPAIEKARRLGIHAFGPYAADGFFGNGLFDKFDGVLAMYHDQGLAPFKTISMESGVNFTAGLPFVRTSPDHGTGYDIAGKNMASEESMRNAIYTAIDILRSRVTYAEMTGNPLPKLYHEKGRDNVVLDLK